MLLLMLVESGESRENELLLGVQKQQGRPAIVDRPRDYRGACFTVRRSTPKDTVYSRGILLNFVVVVLCMQTDRLS